MFTNDISNYSFPMSGFPPCHTSWRMTSNTCSPHDEKETEIGVRISRVPYRKENPGVLWRLLPGPNLTNFCWHLWPVMTVASLLMSAASWQIFTFYKICIHVQKLASNRLRSSSRNIVQRTFHSSSHQNRYRGPSSLLYVLRFWHF